MYQKNVYILLEHRHRTIQSRTFHSLEHLQLLIPTGNKIVKQLSNEVIYSIKCTLYLMYAPGRIEHINAYMYIQFSYTCSVSYSTPTLCIFRDAITCNSLLNVLFTSFCHCTTHKMARQSTAQCKATKGIPSHAYYTIDRYTKRSQLDKPTRVCDGLILNTFDTFQKRI